VLISAPGDAVQDAIALVRASDAFRDVPVLADVSRYPADEVRALGVDDWIHSDDELVGRLENAVRARRLAEREQQSRLRMEMLLEITQAATSSLELDQILGIAVEKVSRVITSDRCSVILVEGEGHTNAHVVASHELPGAPPLQLDLTRYPELRMAMETHQPVRIEDAAQDPLMEEVRGTIAPLGIKSILVQPLICQDDLLGALFLRVSRSEGSFGRDEQEFIQAAAAALANSVRNARMHTALKRKREELESAYVDRYTELTEANQRLKELNRLKDEMIAVCSHDLRSPLNVLLGHGRLLLDNELEPQERASVEAINRQGKKILNLVESLLQRGKLEHGRYALDARHLDAAELCQDTVNEMEILAADRGVTLRAETPESLQAVGDELKLREVLENLIGNAIHHAPRNGEVWVRAQRLKRPNGDIARIVVQDNGSGIPQEQLHLVFDRYRHGPGGTGLGLSICREFVELHGGEIWAETPEQGGCAMVFTLPLVHEDAAQVLPPPVRIEDVLPRVLVVEDEPEVAAVVQEMLRPHYRVEIARDGAEGVARARALKPDLIVMDVFLPRLDGLDAAAALKASSDTADIPVILLSAHQGVADKLRALNLGAVDYLAKPFQGLELLACAERALKLRRTESELERSHTLLRKAGRDPETGLLDRAGFAGRLQQELSRSRRHHRKLCLVSLTPDGPLGDRLRACAVRLRQALRVPDVLGHLGGGAFLMALPECSPADVDATMERILPGIQGEFDVVLRWRTMDAQGEPTAEAAILRLLSPS
jgi:signal transduction histidine kinase/ActR/RegA family two-component response regulator